MCEYIAACPISVMYEEETGRYISHVVDKTREKYRKRSRIYTKIPLNSRLKNCHRRWYCHEVVRRGDSRALLFCFLRVVSLARLSRNPKAAVR